jgi:hypothetical protein
MSVVFAVLASVAHAGSGGWIEFSEETSQRLIADSSRGTNDQAENDFALGDVDNDGDMDLVVARKTEVGNACNGSALCQNQLLMFEGVAEGHQFDGVFVDRTVEYVTDADDGGQGFMDITNDRDIALVDVDDDGWLDIVTAPTISDGLPKTISHPRVYMNKGEVDGVWQGFIYEEARIPQLRTIPGGLAVAPRFCSIGTGDVTGDGMPDLYFGDYDNAVTAPPMPSGHDVNDRLLVNNGDGTFTDSLETRMSGTMLLSAFGMASAIVDMNNDGVLDVVKDTALQVPQRVSISYNNPSNEGFFNNFDIVNSSAPYHTTPADLNQDGRLDLVITDDGTDFYMINTGNGGDGLANFLTFSFQFTTGDDGFGGNHGIADLNQDGFQDVIITDVDVDFDGCSRRMHIFRNLGNLPNVTLQEQGGAAPWTPNGSHDVAVFDINGDTWPDMFIGTCSGHEIWINQPPIGLVFAFPSGLPAFVDGDGETFLVTIFGTGEGVPQPGSAEMFLSVNDGPFNQVAMTDLGNNTYETSLPGGDCTDRYNFYFTAETTTGVQFSDPPGAPANSYSAIVALGTELVLRDEIEDDVSDWIIENINVSTGAWEQADPVGTVSGGDLVAPSDDATAGAGNDLAFVTENGASGGQASATDLDGGPTHLISPEIDLAGTDATISYSYWFYSSNGNTDELEVYVSNSGSGGPWTLVTTHGSSNSAWTTDSFVVGYHVTPTSQVRVRFTAQDQPNDSLTEAGIDNFQVSSFTCSSCSGPEECDDGNVCTDDLCVDSVCQNPFNRVACDDGNACTAEDVCNGGECTGIEVPGCIPCGAPEDCDDGDICTDDDCVGNVCEHTNNVAACDDGDLCTENDTCTDGTCSGSAIPDCDICLSDADCDDSVFCNGDETCNIGTGECVPGIEPCPGQPCDELTETCDIPLQPRSGDPLPDLTPEQLERFLVGRADFDHSFTEAEGLGPIFNQNACGSCHNSPLGGTGSQFVIRAGVQEKGGFDPLEDYGGSLFQKLANDDACLEVVPDLPGIIETQRVTPGMMGYGLVEAINDSEIQALADNQAAGLNGRVNIVNPVEAPDEDRIGRFGWKAHAATILTFSADASKEEMGITNRFFPEDNDPNGIFPPALEDCDTVADPEDDEPAGVAFIDRITDFQRFLAAPPQTPKTGMTGETIFMNIGCGDCHVPSFITGPAPEAALSNKEVRPYSDFLLHDMGLLGDGIESGGANGREFRTTPLMGLLNRDPMLHDGSAAGGTFASRVTLAIQAHDTVLSEGAASAQAFAALPPTDKDLVVAFLGSLGRAEFDFDGDNAVAVSDWYEFRACYTGRGVFYTPDDNCSIADIDQDGDVDDIDFDRFLAAYAGVFVDCNNNAELDFIEIIEGTGPDADVDGNLDHCGAPALAENGPRSIEVDPIDGPDDVALRVTSPDYPCLLKYVAADGSLGDTPVLQSTAAWSAVRLTGGDIVPDSQYSVQVEFAGAVVGELANVTTPIWGDIDANGSANLGDVQLIVLAFQQQFDVVNLEAADIWPCDPNGLANFADIQQGVLAFQGMSFEDVGCTVPCN